METAGCEIGRGPLTSHKVKGQRQTEVKTAGCQVVGGSPYDPQGEMTERQTEMEAAGFLVVGGALTTIRLKGQRGR